nr:hypothetical protein [Chromobacterium sp. ASV5]
MNASEQLQSLIRQHDEQPDACADALRGLLAAQTLPAEDLPGAGWLVNHLIGEQQGRWAEAWALLRPLSQASDHPRLLRNAAVAAALAGEAVAAWALERRVAGAQSAPLAPTRQALRLAALQHLLPALSARAGAEALQGLLEEFVDEACAMDAVAAASLNNAVSTLLERDGLDPADPVCAQALTAGAELARRLWRRAGNWVNDERACYLQALVANRLGDAAAARRAAEEGLALIAANGQEEVDQAFLLLEAARAWLALGQGEAGRQACRQARSLAASFEDAGLRQWFDDKARGLPAAD